MATSPSMATPVPAQAPADPLAQLRDIQLPDAVATWPPAPGWWVLAIVAMLLLVSALLWLWLNYRRNRYRREALAELSSIEQEFQATNDPARFIEQFSALLKRVALTRYPRARVANLTGERWVQFLDSTSSTEEFSLGAGQALIEAGYRTDAEIDVDALSQLGRFWITSHKVGEQVL